MHCFKENNGIIEKYEIVFEKDKLENLKKRIINNCSEIDYYEIESDCSPEFNDRDYIKNFDFTFIKRKENHEEIREIYRYTYEKYTPPYLVILIDSLLSGNMLALSRILEYDASEKVDIDGKIEKVKNELVELIKTEDFDIDKKDSLDAELKRLKHKQRLNRNQQSVSSYYKELLKLIKFELVDTISMEDAKKAEMFFERTLIGNNLYINEEKDCKHLIIKNN